MSSKSSKGNQIHPSAIQNKNFRKGEDGIREIKKTISLHNPESQAGKELNASLSKNAELEKDFDECFSTPQERKTFFRSTRFLEKYLVDFANKSTNVSQGSLHFSREFIRVIRSLLEGDSAKDDTTEEDEDSDENNLDKVKVKEKKKDKDRLQQIKYRRRHSVIEQMVQRETAEIKFTFKRVITSNHEPYQVFTKDTFGKWLIGEKAAKGLLNATKGCLIMISSINTLLCKKLLMEFMFWYTCLNLVIGNSLASIAFGGAQRLAVISTIPVGIALTFADSMPRFLVKNAWYANIFAIAIVIAIIIMLKQLPYDSKLDFNLPVFGTYSWIGVAITALSNYLVMMTKLMVVSLWNPKNFAILKVPLQSTKMMENRADMILVTAEKEKMYKKIGEDGQKLITAIVGSTSDVPWEFTEKTSKSVLFHRLRMDEKHHITKESEFKVEAFSKQTLEQTYRELHDFKDYKVLLEEKSNKANVSPPLPSKRILYRRIKLPFPGMSDRLACIQSVYRYYPEHGFAFLVTHDAEKKYYDQIPKEEKEGTVRIAVRLGGYVLEKMNSRKPMTKVTYLLSLDLGGWIPVGVRNYSMERETKRLEKNWDDKKWNGEGPALFTTEEVIKNLVDERQGSILRASTSRHVTLTSRR
eukprot:g3239.t1